MENIVPLIGMLTEFSIYSGIVPSFEDVWEWHLSKEEYIQCLRKAADKVEATKPIIVSKNQLMAAVALLRDAADKIEEEEEGNRGILIAG